MIHFKILGTGCAKCGQAEAVVREVVEAAGVPAHIEKVEDVESLVAYDVLQTPTVVVNEEVVLRGRVPTAEEVRQMLER